MERLYCVTDKSAHVAVLLHSSTIQKDVPQQASESPVGSVSRGHALSSLFSHTAYVYRKGLLGREGVTVERKG